MVGWLEHRQVLLVGLDPCDSVRHLYRSKVSGRRNHVGWVEREQLGYRDELRRVDGEGTGSISSGSWWISRGPGPGVPGEIWFTVCQILSKLQI